MIKVALVIAVLCGATLAQDATPLTYDAGALDLRPTVGDEPGTLSAGVWVSTLMRLAARLVPSGITIINKEEDGPVGRRPYFIAAERPVQSQPLSVDAAPSLVRINRLAAGRTQ